MRQTVVALVFVAVIVILSQSWYRAVAARHASAPLPALQVLVLPKPRPLNGLQLIDHRNAPFGNAQLQDRWTILFFGYTYCPDICPATMLMLRETARELAINGGPDPRMVFVSVDPERDDIATLGRYVSHFGEAFTGVRGTDEQLQSLAVQVGAMYERGEPDADGQYPVAHSASIFVVNPDGRLHAVLSAPHKPKYISARLADMANRFNALL